MTGPRLCDGLRYRTDWFRVLMDLQLRMFPNTRVALILDVAPSTLRGWKQGAEPTHYDGSRLLELWADVLGKPLSARPMTWD